MGWRWKPPLLSHRPAPAWMYEGGPRSSDWPRADRRGRETRGWSRSFPALLDVGLNELLGVLLQHGVDLVEDLVHLLLQLLGLLGGLGLTRITARASSTLLLGAPLFPFLWHDALLLMAGVRLAIVGRACRRLGEGEAKGNLERLASALDGGDERRGVLGGLEERFDVLAGASERLASGDPLQDVSSGVEDDGVSGGCIVARSSSASAVSRSTFPLSTSR